MLESFARKTRDKPAAQMSITKMMKRHSRLKAITTDWLRSYKAAMKELGNTDKPEIGRWASNSSTSRQLSLNRKYSHTAWRMTPVGNRWRWNEIDFTKHHPHQRLTLRLAETSLR